jgi:plastocyanin
MLIPPIFIINNYPTNYALIGLHTIIPYPSFTFLPLYALLIVILYMNPLLSMSRRYKMNWIVMGATMISILLAIPFVGLVPSETLAQASNTTTATGAANATSAGGGGGETTVVMPLGSSSATGGKGYEPHEITVSPGATVVWDNQDNALHTATSGNPETATPDGKFDTGLVGANQQSKPVTMPTEPGDYTYFCTLHPFLVGTATVQ